MLLGSACALAVLAASRSFLFGEWGVRIPVSDLLFNFVEGQKIQGGLQFSVPGFLEKIYE